MFHAFKDLDRILRGEATQPAMVRQGGLEVPAGRLIGLIVLLGMAYGLCMGSFAVTMGRAGGWMQMLSAMCKVPLLFLLTLLVTFPSLYTFNALVGSRLRFLSVLRLLVAAMSVTLALLASFGTIVAFFSFTTTSYPFMVLFNVVVFALSGFLGLTFLLRTLHRLTVAQWQPDVVETEPVATESSELAPDTLPVERPAGALDPIERLTVTRDVRIVFRFWIIVFALVGAQMSWVMRPFIGGSAEFALFRPRGGNFFEAVLANFHNLFGA